MSAGHHALDAAIDSAIRSVPPAWPLASSVAVNPFLGQAHEDLATAGARLARVAGSAVTPPRETFRRQIASGEIATDDLVAALASATHPLRPEGLAALQAALQRPAPVRRALPTLADLVLTLDGIDWPSLIAERIGAFAGSYFDEGQALWAAPRGRGVYDAWRAFATHDLTPEIAGLSGFALHVSQAPESAREAIGRAVDRLGVSEAAQENYVHRLFMSLGGWSQFARFRLWQAELSGGSDPAMIDLLAIRLVWEEALYDAYRAKVATAWAAVLAAHAAPVIADADAVLDAILQEAAERAAQRRLTALLTGPSPASAPASEQGRPALQAAFCIDVRSEVFRRALESFSPDIRTIGFAGFFGLAVEHRRFGSDVDERRLPVLLSPSLRSVAGTPALSAREAGARIAARAVRAWGRFKFAAVSSFAFVEGAGPIYVSKLLADALGRHAHESPAEPAPRFDPDAPLDRKIATAAGVLRAMSLTQGFARLVILAGHGATVANNPHASALHCGACGGFPGDVNARLLASLLNDPQVRANLVGNGISIPEDTLFVAALHDTTTDEVTLFDGDRPSPAHAPDLASARGWLDAAGRLARTERALRLPLASSQDQVRARSRDWAQTRPEWGLAGCQAFIAAPRSRTAGRDLAGRAFLHDYDWRADPGFGVLESILTAPVVVASWISLQYYGSAVAPEVFGGGDKLLHNVVGGVGVIEGNGGLVRAGLPRQSVSDGERLIHEPLRLTVCVEAPREAIADILARHDAVRDLFDNRWLHLLSLDDAGVPHWRYVGDRRWTDVEARGAVARSAADLVAA